MPASSRKIQAGASVRFTAQIAPATMLTSLTAYRTLDYELVVDGDITELDLTVSHVHDIQHQWSEEVTVAHQRPRLSWIGRPLLLQRSRPAADAGPAGSAWASATTWIPTLMRTRWRRSDKPRSPSPIVSRPRPDSGSRGRPSRSSMADGSSRSITPFTPVAGSTYAYTDRISHTAWTPKLGLRCAGGGRSIRLCLGDARLQERRVQPDVAAVGRGFAPEFAWSYEGGLKATVAQGRATCERRRLPHGLLRPAGADRDLPRGHRHLECGDGNHPRDRVGRRGAPRGEASRPVGTWPGSPRSTTGTSPWAWAASPLMSPAIA